MLFEAGSPQVVREFTAERQVRGYDFTTPFQLFQDTRSDGSPLAPLAQVPGPGGSTTELSGEGHGSSLAPAPGRSGYFYGLTDRGPNADAPDGNKSEMLTSFVPRIGEFRLVGGKAELVRTVTSKGPRSLGGVNYSGRPPHDTSEVIDDVNATNAAGGTPVPVARDPYGYDSEGLVAQPDGSFWVSDEYGPYITHFDADGYELGRLTPYRDSPDNAYHKVIGYLPAELANRAKNKGMEGLTITPDGSTLVGVMQSALQQPDLGKTKAGNVAPTRIVTVNLRTYKTRQYLYLLDDPSATGDANTALAALTKGPASTSPRSSRTSTSAPWSASSTRQAPSSRTTRSRESRPRTRAGRSTCPTTTTSASTPSPSTPTARGRCTRRCCRPPAPPTAARSSRSTRPSCPRS
ncbi:esterase-like activity of phytase family protein [Actinacidiphila bryophytorum]|uniref:esterase-like activity of phytase family protein n=1 Tax=Actinacidiphila bryophytorum TaxID=1436133 RepID=UPI00196214F2|nr:esterase-like activity of phytase family protein [Actinacidiphila bryophytorum]MBM9435851.1 esterase-like activity of phytase family protein [Actinacidiphila bryophytorum]MBN6543286.1 esterase-like activity of phytase family protein [Actinacidiphila bryophytorum]